MLLSRGLLPLELAEMLAAWAEPGVAKRPVARDIQRIYVPHAFLMALGLLAIDGDVERERIVDRGSWIASAPRCCGNDCLHQATSRCVC